jgi:hypothetical protein
MRLLNLLLVSACTILLGSCANVPTNFKFDPAKPTGLVVGTISYESGLGKYFLIAMSQSAQAPVELGFGCPIWPCIEPADDPAFSKDELPKQRGGGFAVEIPEGVYRIVGWRVVQGAARSRSTSPINIDFRVERGRASYIGNLHFDGDWENVSLRDRSSRDLPLLQAKYDVLRTIPIAFTISPGAEITKLGGAYQRTMHIEGPIFVPARR